MKALDILADRHIHWPAFNKGVVMLITSLGIAIGLAWENVFHDCVEVSVDFMVESRSVLFRVSDDPKVWAFVLSAVIVLTVLPAYRWYVVPTMYHLLEEWEDAMEKLEHEEAERIEARSSAVSSPGGYFAVPVAAVEQTYTFNAAPCGLGEGGLLSEESYAHHHAFMLGVPGELSPNKFDDGCQAGAHDSSPQHPWAAKSHALLRDGGVDVQCPRDGIG